MIYYLNLGFIVEQAIADVVRRYMDRQQFDDVYGNFHISVTNEHPFAHMMIENNSRCADNFPSIVITSQSDSKPSDIVNLPPQFIGIGLTSEDIDDLVNSVYRVKTKINENGEVVSLRKNGVPIEEKIPGFVLVSDTNSIQKLKDIANSRESKKVFGIKTSTRRRDRISVEIWAENNQLKNEIYEHLRVLFTTTFDTTLNEQYKIFSPTVFDNTINGERSSNYNFDFDTVLCGSHISFEIDYDTAQIVLDTEINEINKNLFIEVINHVKNS